MHGSRYATGVFLLVLACTFLPSSIHAEGKASDAMCTKGDYTCDCKWDATKKECTGKNAKGETCLKAKPCEDSNVRGACVNENFCGGESCQNNGTWGKCELPKLDLKSLQSTGSGAAAPAPGTDTKPKPNSLIDQLMVPPATTPSTAQPFKQTDSSGQRVGDFLQSTQSFSQPKDVSVTPNPSPDLSGLVSGIPSADNAVKLEPQDFTGTDAHSVQTVTTDGAPYQPSTFQPSSGDQPAASKGIWGTVSGWASDAKTWVADTYKSWTGSGSEPVVSTQGFDEAGFTSDSQPTTSQTDVPKTDPYTYGPDDAKAYTTPAYAADLRSQIDDAKTRLDAAAVAHTQFIDRNAADVKVDDKGNVSIRFGTQADIDGLKAIDDKYKTAATDYNTAVSAYKELPASTRVVDSVSVANADDNAKIAALQQQLQQHQQQLETDGKLTPSDAGYPQAVERLLTSSEVTTNLQKQLTDAQQRIDSRNNLAAYLQSTPNAELVAKSFTDQPTTPDAIAARNAITAQVAEWGKSQDVVTIATQQRDLLSARIAEQRDIIDDPYASQGQVRAAQIRVAQLGTSLGTIEAEIRNSQGDMTRTDSRIGDLANVVQGADIKTVDPKVQSLITTAVSDSKGWTFDNVMYNGYAGRALGDGLKSTVQAMDLPWWGNVVNPVAWASAGVNSSLSLFGNPTVSTQLNELSMSNVNVVASRINDGIVVATLVDPFAGSPIMGSLSRGVQFAKAADFVGNAFVGTPVGSVADVVVAPGFGTRVTDITLTKLGPDAFGDVAAVEPRFLTSSSNGEILVPKSLAGDIPTPSVTPKIIDVTPTVIDEVTVAPKPVSPVVDAAPTLTDITATQPVATPAFTPSATQIAEFTKPLKPLEVQPTTAEVTAITNYNNALETYTNLQTKVNAGVLKDNTPLVRGARDQLYAAGTELQNAGLSIRTPPSNLGQLAVDSIYRTETSEILAQRAAPLASETPYDLVPGATVPAPTIPVTSAPLADIPASLTGSPVTKVTSAPLADIPEPLIANPVTKVTSAPLADVAQSPFSLFTDFTRPYPIAKVMTAPLADIPSALVPAPVTPVTVAPLPNISSGFNIFPDFSLLSPVSSADAAPLTTVSSLTPSPVGVVTSEPLPPATNPNVSVPSITAAPPITEITAPPAVVSTTPTPSVTAPSPGPTVSASAPAPSVVAPSEGAPSLFSGIADALSRAFPSFAGSAPAPSPIIVQTQTAPRVTSVQTIFKERVVNPLADLLNPSRLPLAPEPITLSVDEKITIEQYSALEGTLTNLRSKGISATTPVYNSYNTQLTQVRGQLDSAGLRVDGATGAIYKGDTVVAVQRPVVFPGESPYAVVAPVAGSTKSDTNTISSISPAPPGGSGVTVAHAVSISDIFTALESGSDADLIAALSGESPSFTTVSPDTADAGLVPEPDVAEKLPVAVWDSGAVALNLARAAAIAAGIIANPVSPFVDIVAAKPAPVSVAPPQQLSLPVVTIGSAQTKRSSTYGWDNGSGDSSTQKLAGGGTLNNYPWTIADNTSKLGRRYLVTNPATGKSVIAEVRDRGPYVIVDGVPTPHPTRLVDVSRAVAEAIGMPQTVQNLVFTPVPKTIALGPIANKSAVAANTEPATAPAVATKPESPVTVAATVPIPVARPDSAPVAVTPDSATPPPATIAAQTAPTAAGLVPTAADVASLQAEIGTLQTAAVQSAKVASTLLQAQKKLAAANTHTAALARQSGILYEQGKQDAAKAKSTEASNYFSSVVIPAAQTLSEDSALSVVQARILKSAIANAQSSATKLKTTIDGAGLGSVIQFGGIDKFKAYVQGLARTASNNAAVMVRDAAVAANAVRAEAIAANNSLQQAQTKLAAAQQKIQIAQADEAARAAAQAQVAQQQIVASNAPAPADVPAVDEGASVPDAAPVTVAQAEPVAPQQSLAAYVAPVLPAVAKYAVINEVNAPFSPGSTLQAKLNIAVRPREPQVEEGSGGAQPASPPPALPPAPTPEDIAAAQTEYLDDSVAQTDAFKNFARQKLTGDDARVQEAAIAKYLSEKDALLEDYRTYFGDKVVNPDLARLLFRDVGYSGANSGAIQNVVADMSETLWRENLAINPDTYAVIYTGSAGAGKSTTVQQVLPQISSQSAAVLDGTLANPVVAQLRIAEALRVGKTVEVVNIYRDPVDAWNNGVIARMNGDSLDAGRVVPISVFIVGYKRSLDVVKTLLNDPRVHVSLIDNSRGAGNAAAMTPEEFLNITYSKDIERTIRDDTKKLLDTGAITAEQYAAITGAEAPAKLAVATTEPIVPVETVPAPEFAAVDTTGIDALNATTKLIQDTIAESPVSAAGTIPVDTAPLSQALSEAVLELNITNHVQELVAGLRAPQAVTPVAYVPQYPFAASWTGSQVDTQVQTFGETMRGVVATIENIPARIRALIPGVQPVTYQPLAPLPASQSLTVATPQPTVTTPSGPTIYVDSNGVGSTAVPEPVATTPTPVSGTVTGTLDTRAPLQATVTTPTPLTEPKTVTLAEEPQIDNPVTVPDWYAAWTDFAKTAENNVLFALGETPATPAPSVAINAVPVHSPPETAPVSGAPAPTTPVETVAGPQVPIDESAPTITTPVSQPVAPAPQATPAAPTPVAAAPTYSALNTTGLVLRVARGAVLPSDFTTIKGGITKNVIVNGISYGVAGGAAPLVNMTYRFVVNKAYRTDVISLVKRVFGSSSNTAAPITTTGTVATPQGTVPTATAPLEISRSQLEVLAGRPLTDAEAAQLGYGTSATLPTEISREQLEVLTGQTMTDAEFAALTGGGSGGPPPTVPPGGGGGGGGGGGNQPPANAGAGGQGGNSAGSGSSLKRTAIIGGTIAALAAGGYFLYDSVSSFFHALAPHASAPSPTTAPKAPTVTTTPAAPCKTPPCTNAPPVKTGTDVTVTPAPAAPAPQVSQSGGNLGGFGSILGALLSRLLGQQSSQAQVPAQTPQTPVSNPISPIIPSATSTSATSTPVVTLIANPGTITSGLTSMLSWSSVGTSQCYLIALNSTSTASVGLNGSTSTLPLATTTVYTVSCSALSGAATTTATTTVQVH